MRPASAAAPGRGWMLRAGLGAGLLGGAWLALKSSGAQQADVRLGDAVRRASTPQLDRAVSLTTDLGSIYAVFGIAAVLAAAGRRRRAADVLGVGLAAWNLSQHSKTLVRRQRPYEADGVRRLIRPPAGSSFPSGHAAVSAAVMTVLAGQARGRGGARLFRALAAYVAVTRVYVGVHYPTDVVGGAGMGLVLGSLWRGPVAGAGRAALRAGARAARAASLPALRIAVAAALGVRLGRAPAPALSRSERQRAEAA